MDRFGFRVWDILERKMLSWGDIFHLPAWEIFPGTPEQRAFNIMQCTGLKDKNGTLIYEGDIVTCQTRYGIDRGVVVWKDGGLRVFWESHLSFPDKFHVQMYYEFTSYNEIIGNIHENAELLEG